MTQIELNDATAAKLTAEATKAGLTVDAYVQTVLLCTDSMKSGVATKESGSQTNTGGESLVGCMAEFADELDKAVEYAMEMRKRERLRDLNE